MPADRRSSGKVANSKKDKARLYEPGEGATCHANFDNQAPHVAKIVERREDANGAISYYVHYMDQDKRMDEWLGADRMIEPVDIAHYTEEKMLEDSLMTRGTKRKFQESHPTQDAHDKAGVDQQAEQEHQEKTRMKNIQCLVIGQYEITAWYFSPYPEEFHHLDKLYVCEFCLKYFRKLSTFVRHMHKCEERHPPGDEIYRSEPKGQAESSSAHPVVAVFEVDGSKHKFYCQSLCLMSKLFLDHKTLYYDVDQFLFYVLCEMDEDCGSYHIVGYFSKEKSSVENNLACILVLPPHQKKGYGTFQMQFSYELSKIEGKAGGPETPLSDLGQVAYRHLWQRMIMPVVQANRTVSLKEIVEATGIRREDVGETLKELKLAHYYKGGWSLLSLSDRDISAIIERIKKPGMTINPERLHWSPYSASSLSKQ